MQPTASFANLGRSNVAKPTRYETFGSQDIRDIATSHNSVGGCLFWESTIGNRFWETFLSADEVPSPFLLRSRPEFSVGTGVGSVVTLLVQGPTTLFEFGPVH